MSGSENRRSLVAVLIASASSAGAAVVVRALWEPGTIASAAMTPFLVALFDELLHRHTERLASVARERFSGSLPLPAAALRGGQVLAPRTRWRRIAAMTLGAFAIGGGALTGAELLLHHSVAGRANATTLFGGPSVRAAAPPEPPQRGAPSPAPGPPPRRRAPGTRSGPTQATTPRPKTTPRPRTTPPKTTPQPTTTPPQTTPQPTTPQPTTTPPLTSTSPASQTSSSAR